MRIIILYISGHKKYLAMAVCLIVLSAMLLLGIHEKSLRDHLHLNKKNIHTITGKTWKLKTNAKRKVEWKSANKEIARVDEEGNVYAKSAGETKITAKSMGRELECTVAVDEPALNTDHLDMLIGSTAEVMVEDTTFSPSVSITGNNIRYDGTTVTATDTGQAEMHFNAGGKELACSVNVKEPQLEKTYKAEKGEKLKIKLKNAPINDYKAKWNTDNEAVAKITSENQDTVKLICRNAGIATLTATISGKKYNTTIEVRGDQQMSIEGEKVEKGKSLKLNVKNTMSSYVITWKKPVIVKDNEPIFQGTERGTFTITAVVDTGLEKKEISKEIQVLEKKLNTQSWEGSTGESFDLILQDAENASYEYDSEKFELQGTKFTAIQSGESTITVRDGDETFTCTAKVHSSAEKLLDAMDKVAAIIGENEFYYGNHGWKHSIDEALETDSKAVNCMIGVSWALQEAGLLDKGDIIYYNSSGLHGGGASQIMDSPQFTIFYPGADPEDIDLIPGDILCFTTPHMAMYAGKSDDGHFLYYSSGRDGTDTRKAGGTFVKKSGVGPRRQDYYKDIDCIIRCR